MRTAASSTRPVKRRAQQTRDRIERAALAAFADAGFDGASTGEIARRADVTQQLVIYHFETKLELWKSVADRIFGAMRDRFAQRVHGLEGVDPSTRLRLLIRDFVRFSAEHPELARFMTHEGNRPGPRLSWLVERHLRPTLGTTLEEFVAAQREGVALPGDPIHLAYLLIGSAAIFAQAAEVELLTGLDPMAPEQVEAYADLVVRMLLPNEGRRPNTESARASKRSSTPRKKRRRR